MAQDRVEHMARDEGVIDPDAPVRKPKAAFPAAAMSRGLAAPAPTGPITVEKINIGNGPAEKDVEVVGLAGNFEIISSPRGPSLPKGYVPGSGSRLVSQNVKVDGGLTEGWKVAGKSEPAGTTGEEPPLSLGIIDSGKYDPTPAQRAAQIEQAAKAASAPAPMQLLIKD